jgi:hypothetical protein
MPLEISLPVDDLWRNRFDQEIRELLLALADMDLHQEEYWPFLRPLIQRRLKEINEECSRRGITPSDIAGFDEALRQIPPEDERPDG